MELLHTLFTQSVKYLDTCNDVVSVGFKDGVIIEPARVAGNVPSPSVGTHSAGVAS